MPQKSVRCLLDNVSSLVLSLNHLAVAFHHYHSLAMSSMMEEQPMMEQPQEEEMAEVRFSRFVQATKIDVDNAVGVGGKFLLALFESSTRN